MAGSALTIYEGLQDRLNKRFFGLGDITKLIEGLGNVVIKDVEQLKRFWWASLNEVFLKVKDSQPVVSQLIAS